MNSTFAIKMPCRRNRFDCYMHFAGFKAVVESVQKARDYYDNNMTRTLTLVDVLRQNDFENIIFSSSAPVCGGNNHPSVTEGAPKSRCTSPYGEIKSFIESILPDLCAADSQNHNLLKNDYLHPHRERNHKQ